MQNNASLKAIKSLHIFTDPDSPPISGYILIKDSEIQSILPLDSPDLSQLKTQNYQILDYENCYIFPGLIDLNVHLNSICDPDWEDIENIGKMALQGGITTILDNPLMGVYSDKLDETQALTRRISSLEGKLYTDTGLLAYLGPHNLESLEEIWSKNKIIGFRLYLAKSLMHQLPHFETKHYPSLQKKLETVMNQEYRFFVHCESASGRDLFTCSPLRYREKEERLDLKVDIKDSSKFGGGIQGEMGELDDDSNKESSSDSEAEEIKDNVNELKPNEKNEQKPEEIQSGVLRKKADKNAKLQEEQSIARLEIVGYAFNEEEKEIIKNLNSSDSELEYEGHSTDSSEEEDTKIQELHSIENITNKEIKVENIKKNIVANKVIGIKALGQKRNSFLNNPLIGSLRDALGHLNYNEQVKQEEEESKMTQSQPHFQNGIDATVLIRKDEDPMFFSQPNTCEIGPPRNKNRNPSSLLQRRKITGSPNHQSPNQTSPENQNLAEFKIKCKKAAEEQDEYEKELKINRDYQLFLSNHSLSWETNGVGSVLTFLSESFRKDKSKGTLILSNLSSSNSAFLVRSKAKALDYNLNVYCETSLPFIYFQRNHIKPGQSKFKCSPCIRDKETRNLLIDGLMLKNLFHAVSSFHLQVDKKYKKVERGNFKRCFNGVSTIGSNLQVVWTKLYLREKKKLDKEAKNEKKYEHILKRLVDLLASSPAEIAGLEKKGKIRAGFDADLVVWNPFKLVEMDQKNIHLKYKCLYLFKSQKFYGEVKETFLRGKCVFSSNDQFVKNGVIISHK